MEMYPPIFLRKDFSAKAVKPRACVRVSQKIPLAAEKSRYGKNLCLFGFKHIDNIHW